MIQVKQLAERVRNAGGNLSPTAQVWIARFRQLKGPLSGAAITGRSRRSFYFRVERLFEGRAAASLPT
jgi:hypothetical protein